MNNFNDDLIFYRKHKSELEDLKSFNFSYYEMIKKALCKDIKLIYEDMEAFFSKHTIDFFKSMGFKRWNVVIEKINKENLDPGQRQFLTDLSKYCNI